MPLSTKALLETYYIGLNIVLVLVTYSLLNILMRDFLQLQPDDFLLE